MARVACVRSPERFDPGDGPREQFSAQDRLALFDAAHFEVTTACNLACPGCNRTLHAHGYPSKSMEIGAFQFILGRLPPMRSYYFHGLGEPTLHPDLARMIGLLRARDPDAWIGVVTNLVTGDPGRFEALFDAGLSTLSVSVDALEPGLCETLRRGTDLPRLLRNLAYLAPRHDLRVVSLVSDKTWRQAVGLLDDLDRRGLLEHLSEVQFQPFEAKGGSAPARPLEPDEREAFIEAMDVAEVRTRYPERVFLSSDFRRQSVPCWFPFRVVTVMVGGEVSPCCRVFDPTHVDLGSLLADSFAVTIGGESFRSICEAILAGDYPPFCAGCFANPASFG